MGVPFEMYAGQNVILFGIIQFSTLTVDTWQAGQHDKSILSDALTKKH